MLVGLVVVACARPPAAPPTETPVHVTSPAFTTASPVRALVPVRVSAPTMDLDEPLIELGLNPDNTMEVPKDHDDVGWFTGGGRPGRLDAPEQVGPTVLAGHVDSTTGPSVFFRLRELAVGDDVTVTTQQGIDARYRVTDIGDYPKSEFPTARVFGAVPRDEIRLITCSGGFDDRANSYEDNLVVYGIRVA
nr:sortase [Rhodococcus kroppenstedtii]